MRWLGKLLVALLGLAALLFAGLWWAGRQVDRVVNPAPQSIVATSLESLREQNRLSAFVASYVSVATTTQRRFGLTAKKTMIVPGTVRYEVDLARLVARDVTWDVATRELKVVLPPIEVVGPEIDLTRIREYDAGGLLMAMTDAGKALDAGNRRAAQADLIAQARRPVPIALAKDATRRAIAHSFSLPLRAAGLAATVRVRFADEPGFPAADRDYMDGSRAVADVIGGARREDGR